MSLGRFLVVSWNLLEPLGVSWGRALGDVLGASWESLGASLSGEYGISRDLYAKYCGNHELVVISCILCYICLGPGASGDGIPRKKNRGKPHICTWFSGSDGGAARDGRHHILRAGTPSWGPILTYQLGDKHEETGTWETGDWVIIMIT